MTDIQKERLEVSQRCKKLSPFKMLLFSAVIECGLAIANDPNSSSSLFLSLISTAMDANNKQQENK